MEEPRRSGGTVGDVIDAVITYDAPILDHRFTRLIEQHPDPRIREELLELPAIVTRGARLTQEAGIEWERVASPVLLEEFVRKAERFLLEALLDSAEGQIRLKAFLSRHAPVAAARDPIEEAIALHRDATAVLRRSLATLAQTGAGENGVAPREQAPRFVGEEAPSGDLRSHVEGAIRRMRSEGYEPRALTLSHVALRHLRDEGCFRDGKTTILGVSVEVDFSWDAPKYALRSYDTVALEEIFRGGTPE